MTYHEQLDRWVAGDSVCLNEDGECVPDFSCCRPEMQNPRAVRESIAATLRARREAARAH